MENGLVLFFRFALITCVLGLLFSISVGVSRGRGCVSVTMSALEFFHWSVMLGLSIQLTVHRTLPAVHSPTWDIGFVGLIVGLVICGFNSLVFPLGLAFKSFKREDHGWYVLWSLAFLHWSILYSMAVYSYVHNNLSVNYNLLLMLGISGLAEFAASQAGLISTNLQNEQRSSTIRQPDHTSGTDIRPRAI
jgi:hypothetical protein